jgi:hypothetical protein
MGCWTRKWRRSEMEEGTQYPSGGIGSRSLEETRPARAGPGRKPGKLGRPELVLGGNPAGPSRPMLALLRRNRCCDETDRYARTHFASSISILHRATNQQMRGVTGSDEVACVWPMDALASISTLTESTPLTFMIAASNLRFAMLWGNYDPFCCKLLRDLTCSGC